MKKVLASVLALPLLLAAQSVDVLATMRGASGALKEGAEGLWEKSASQVKFTKTNSAGYIIYAGNSKFDPAITPGKLYEATAEFEISGSAAGALMLSMPGGKRRPFPIETLKKSGKAVIIFTARPDEKQVHFHAVVRGNGQVTVKSMTLKEIQPDEYNHLLALNGVAKMHEGASGRAETSGGVVTITKTNEAGYILYAGNSRKELPIVPGKSYEVATEMEISGSATGALMLAMPGGKRRPFPLKSLSKSGIAAIRFTAAPDETKLRLHLVVRGEGEVQFKNLFVREMPAADPLKKSFNGKELRQFWSVQNAISENYFPGGLAGECSERTRVASPTLLWRADEIPAVEVDMSYTPDGGPMSIHFTGVENGKTFRGSLKRTNIPSGETRTVTFYFANQPQWRGTITGISFGFDIHSHSEFTVTGVRALSKPNLIPDAAKPGKKEIEMFRPGAKYSLSYHGKDNPGVTLKIFDVNAKCLKTYQLDPDSEELKFTSPLTAVYAEIEYGKGGGYPLLECKQLPFFGNLPEVYWTAPWIWCSVRNYPQDTVHFSREFTLPAAVKRAEARYTADDGCVLNINGNRFRKAIRNLHKTEKRDITSMLKSGLNRIEIAVENDSGPGALLFELYAELESGEVFTLKGDRSWSWSYQNSSGKAVERGIPPRGEWGDKIDCRYIGPRAEAEIRDFTETGFAIKPAAACGDYGEVMMTVTSNTGEKRQMQVKIAPRSGEWKPGAWNQVKLFFNPELTAGMKGDDFTLKIEPEFFAVPENLSCRMTPRGIEPCDFPTVKLVGAGSRPYFEVNGKKLAPFYFDLPFSFIDMPMQKAHFVANAAKAGSNIVRSWYGLRDFWKGPNEFDFSSLDFAMAVMRANMPDAHLIITFKTYMPDWWLKENPGHRIEWFKENGQYRNYYQTMASLKWKEDAKIGIKALMDHLRKNGNAKMVIGIAFADGDTCEWLWASHPYGGKHHFIFQSKAPADRESFAAFLTKKYGKLPYDPEIPVPETWGARDEGIFLDPVKSQKVSDYWEFRSQCCSDGIRTFTKFVKDYSKRKLMSGAYYGYHIQLSRVFHLFQGSGHHRLNEVATSGNCDLYFAPTMYGLRVPGESDSTMQPAEAITGNGGIPIMEFDYRTYSEFTPGQLHNGAADTPKTTLSLLDKGFGCALVRAAGGHWMELHERWFREPLQYKHVGKLLQLYRSLPETPAGTVPKDVCIVNTETSNFRTANNTGDGVYRAVIYELCRLMPRAGAAYRHVLLKDLLTPGKVPAHKFYIFTDFFELTDAQRQAIKSRLAKENAHALWMYAPGVLKPGEKVNAAGITEMTGIEVTRLNHPWQAHWESTPEFGGKTHYAYLTTGLNFRPAGGFDTVVARSGKYPSVVGRKNGSRTDYFAAALVPQEHAMQEMLRRAGVRIYQRGTDNLHAGNDFLVLHASTSGEKELLIPAGHRVRQVLGPEVTVDPRAPKWQAKAGWTYGFMLERDK
ncbi:MAG: hypothetical protein E7041_08265 [Lentisphaerae bacterium]|nr:hypothetical protein [Lentisphaerota bacterium]